MHGAIYWLMLCKQPDATLRKLFNAPLSSAQWKAFDAFLISAKVPEEDRAKLRDQFIAAAIFPKQVEILTRAASRRGYRRGRGAKNRFGVVGAEDAERGGRVFSAAPQADRTVG
ncbi:MAG: hypothetical protein QM811_05605 [Pirellulales bacterium]